MTMVPADDDGDDMYNWAAAIKEAQDVVHAQGPSAEACGFIEDSVVVVVPNIARGTGEFAFSERDCERVYDALERGALNGVWHSHPGGHPQPSEHDWMSQPRGVDMYIIVLMNAEPPQVVRYDDMDRAAR